MILLHTLRPGDRFALRWNGKRQRTGTLISKTPSAAVVRYDDEIGKPANPSTPTVAIALNSEVEEI